MAESPSSIYVLFLYISVFPFSPKNLKLLDVSEGIYVLRLVSVLCMGMVSQVLTLGRASHTTVGCAACLYRHQTQWVSSLFCNCGCDLTSCFHYTVYLDFLSR